ncbi:hypothetical protein GYH30_035223 [Glycine max]|nr:hypothetical protein GYH30_035223 [Glycine max]
MISYKRFSLDCSRISDCGGLCKTRRIVHWRPNVRHSAQGLWNMLCEVQVYPI